MCTRSTAYPFSTRRAPVSGRACAANVLHTKRKAYVYRAIRTHARKPIRLLPHGDRHRVLDAAFGSRSTVRGRGSTHPPPVNCCSRNATQSVPCGAIPITPHPGGRSITSGVMAETVRPEKKTHPRIRTGGVRHEGGFQARRPSPKRRRRRWIGRPITSSAAAGPPWRP